MAHISLEQFSGIAPRVGPTELGPTQASGVSGASGTMLLNTNTISANYTLPSNTNAHSMGPITQLSGTTVLVPATQRWLIV
jgi:hypothetical protein